MTNDLYNKNIEILSSTLIHPDSKLHHLQFINMTDEESRVFVDKAVNELKDDLLADTLLYLALFTNGKCLVPHYDKIISKGVFYPCEIYIHADSNIAQKLIDVIESHYSRVNVNHILICLAWIGTPNVIDFFLKSTLSKPSWTKDLYVSPKEFAEQASWTIDSDNKKNNLFSQQVIPLVKSEQSSCNNDIKTFAKHTDNCKWCNNTLTTVFKISEKEFTTCLFCGCFGNFYMQLNDKGQSSWHAKNIKPEYLPENTEMDIIPENTLKVSSEKRLPSYTISEFTYNTKSQIGGFPTWIQDAEHINCIDCNKKMQYIGQIDMGEVEEYGEGNYYFHHCPDCKTTGTNYQQT